MNSKVNPQVNSDCFERQQLMAYATRLLDPTEEARVHAHLAAGCEACRAVVNEYRTLDSVLEEWKPAEPSPWFDARLRSAIASGSSPKHGLFGPEGRWLARWPRWLAPALAAALVVAVSVVAVRVNRNHIGGAMAQKTQPAMSRPSGAAVGTVPGQPGLQPGSEEAGTAETGQRAAEDDEMLANFDVLSELPAPPQGSQVDN